jgi:hydroxymethylpyrimidine/phosphomethylpyrimidine kinase
VLAIGGSDSGGGAGIQADIKTLTALGVYAAAAVTAVTVQDTTGVHAVHPVPPDIVKAQIARVLDDIGADAIKTGMLGDAETLRAVVEVLAAKAARIPLVVDPVMTAKGGAALLKSEAVDVLCERLLPMAALLTPNAPEAEWLTGKSIGGEDDQIAVARELLAMGARAVLLKGGHIGGGTVSDVLVTRDGVAWFRSPRMASLHTHGTGCTLASACAAGLAQGMSLHDSVSRAHAFVQEAIKTAPGFGKGSGPLNHMHGIAKR